MTVQNAEIADRFEHLADLLELEGANPFRVRAYRNAARFIRGHARSLAEMLEEGAELAAAARGCRAGRRSARGLPARELGVKLAIATDAHRVADLDLMRFGVDQARRGWLEPDDVVNTRPLAELRRLLRP